MFRVTIRWNFPMLKSIRGYLQNYGSLESLVVIQINCTWAILRSWRHTFFHDFPYHLSSDQNLGYVLCTWGIKYQPDSIMGLFHKPLQGSRHESISLKFMSRFCWKDTVDSFMPGSYVFAFQNFSVLCGLSRPPVGFSFRFLVSLVRAWKKHTHNYWGSSSNMLKKKHPTPMFFPKAGG